MPPNDPFSPDELFSWVELQSNLGPRRPGSPAGIANEDFIFSQLKQFGLSDVRRESVPVTYWNEQESSLTVNGKSFPVFGIPYTPFTSEGGAVAPLVYADPGCLFANRSWKGRIVVAEIGFPALDISLLFRLAMGMQDSDNSLREVNHPATWIRLGWHLYRLAVKSGAVGFVGILKDQPGGSARMYAPYGFKEKDILDKALPGLWAGKHDRERLVKAAKRGEGAHLILRGTHVPAASHNIIGEIPGQGDEVIVLSTHHDSPFTSPVEDASGVAVVLALARHLASLPKLRRRIVVLFTSGHFYGSIGTRSFISQHRYDIVARTALEISIEHIALEAVENSDGELVATGRPEPAALFVGFNRAVCELLTKGLSSHGLERSILLPAEGPLGDYPPTDGGDWYEAGIPVVNYISNPVYLLTDDDALKWVDKKRLSLVAKFFADFIKQSDGVSKEKIGRVDFPIRLGLMKLLKHLLRAKTTCFGLKPVH